MLARFVFHTHSPPFAAIAALLLPLAAWAGHPAFADIIVLANRTGGQLTARFQPGAARAEQLVLPVGEVRPMFLDGRATVEFPSVGGAKRYQLEANSAYYLGRDGRGQVDLQRIGLGDDKAVPRRALPGTADAPAAIVDVKILVDEEEPARQFVWEPRLRKRIAAASAILEKHCRVQLRVVAVDTWNSDNATTDFVASLTEFENEVKPLPARLAIGFTGQFPMVRGRVHLAGTRGPLHTHILVREGSPQINEPERLEFLVHELGHFLGAAHSPEKTSVMRPVLGDNMAGRSDFVIRFDPVNTLVTAIVGEEMRRRNVQRFADLSTDGKRQLQRIYGELDKALPNDAAASQYSQIAKAGATAPVAAGAERVLVGIGVAAVANSVLPTGTNQAPDKPSRRTGDALTEYYVRQAAAIADTLSDEIAPTALLWALSVGLDNTDSPLAGQIALGAPAIETFRERTRRLAIIGEPTLRGRRDLTRRFFAAAYQAADAGAEAAQAASISRELRSVQADGFSFARLTVDRAGIRFGNEVKRGRFTLPMLSRGFSIEALVPAIDGLPEPLTAAQLAAQFGGPEDDRFRNRMLVIDQQILLLPFYRPAAPPSGR